MTRRKAFITVLSLFLISIVIRLPNLNRPVSKHHEFMTALVMINIESWRQAGGGNKFHYVPLLNFQNAGDKHFGKSIWADKEGNQWYLSLGPGWYIIPYFIYQILHLPAETIYLRMINLLFNLFSVALFFYFLEQMLPSETENRYQLIISSCLLFMFTPGMQWYLGNGYAHTGIMMPFVIAFLILVLPMFMFPEKIGLVRLFSLAILIVIFVFIDWFIIFLCVATGLSALWKVRSKKRYAWLLGVLFLASATGILLIFLQFASYAGADAVGAYWKARFLIRTVASDSTPFPVMTGYLLIHLITSYLPLIVLLAAVWLWSRYKKKAVIFSKKEILFFKLYACSLLLYNLILLEWSYEHEFSMLPWSVLLAYIGARLIYSSLNKKNRYILAASFLLVSVSQYYFINRPGNISRDGMAYNTFQIFGEQLRQVPVDYKIFSPLETNAPMIEYYAGRNISIKPSYEEAKRYMHERNITKAVWVEQEKYQLKKIIIIK